MALPLRAAILAVLAGGVRLTAKAIALRLGRPRDRELYHLLGRLLEERLIATDPTDCTFYRRER